MKKYEVTFTFTVTVEELYPGEIIEPVACSQLREVIASDSIRPNITEVKEIK